MTDILDFVRRVNESAGGTLPAWGIVVRVTVLLSAAVLVALVLRRSSAALRHMVWTLSLVGTLLIPLCSWVLPAWQWAVLPQRQPSPPSIDAVTKDAPAVAPRADVAPPRSAHSPPPLGGRFPFPAVPSADQPLEVPVTPTGAVADHPTPLPAPQPNWSWPMFLTAVWAIGSSLGLAWIVVGVTAAWYVARRARPSTDPHWREILEQLLGPCGIRRAIEIRECPQVSVPMTWGVFRPVILVPAGTAAWTEEIKRSVLLHELGHICRGDCLMLLLGRLACVAYWFHPQAWLAVRQLRKTSEQAADDLVLAANVAPPDYAEHLVGIAARMHGLHLFGHVALPMASRSDLEGRVLAILDPRRNHRSLKRKTCYALTVVFALLLIPCSILRLGYAGEKKADEPTAANAASGPTESGTTNLRFELTILGPDKKPVPRCSVEVRSDVRPTEESVQQGTFTKKSSYGALLRADASGVLILNLPQKPKRFEISIVQPGYGPYSAEWRSEENAVTIPAQFIAELDAGWSVGGIIVDSQGHPIAGAVIEPVVDCKKPPADTRNLRCGTELTTNAEGKWRFDCVPVFSKAVFVEINDPNFQPADCSLPRTQFEIRSGGQPAAKIELQRGVTVKGKVTDETGKPIADALIRTVFRGQIRRAKTSENGAYQLRGCEPALARIVVSAKGRALDMKELLLSPAMGPLDFQMQPGGKVRVRVLDEKGNPVAKAYVAIDGWRGLEYSEAYFAFADVDPHADAAGVWQWNEAPLDEFKADICPPGGMRLEMQRLIARHEEYVFRTHLKLVISGSVVDSKTRQPVKSFRVVPGIRRDDVPAGRPAETRIDWRSEGSYLAKDGKYRIERSREELAHLLRIEADGYRVVVSRDIKSNEGKVQVDFALVKAKDIAATLLTPDGHPAARAKIAIGIAGSQIMVKNGRIDGGQTYAARCDADEAGHFKFPAQDLGILSRTIPMNADEAGHRVPAKDGAYQLVIVHPTGFAYLKSAEHEIPGTITLTAWARVEGTFRAGSKTVPNARIEIDSDDINSYGDGVASISTECAATTGPDGRFVFDRVFPGRGHIGRGIVLMVNQGATEVTSEVRIAANFPAGKTTHFDLGGSGRQVVGKLAGPAGSNEKVHWQFAQIEAYVDLPVAKLPTVPADVEKDWARRKAWWTKWQATADGRSWQAEYERYDKLRRESPYIFATADGDGAFHIDDVPAGSYLLNVRFEEHSAGCLSNYRFTVPPVDGGRSSKPLDLGTLTLEKEQENRHD